MDYPRAWEIADAVSIKEHDAECHFRRSDGGILCNCPVIYKHPEYLEDEDFVV